MKHIFNKMIYSKSSSAVLSALAFFIAVSTHAQNHNPVFEVSNLSIQSGSNFILIGDDNDAVFDPRTEVTLRFRDPPQPDASGTTTYNGETTLQWSSGSSNVLAFDEEDQMIGFNPSFSFAT